MSLLFLIFLDIFLGSVEALGRIRPLTPWEGEQTCGLHWQRLFRGMETRSSKARSSKSESWLGFFPANPLLIYSKGRSVQMCLALQLFILVRCVGCTWKVDKGWKRGCNFFSTHMRNTTPKALSTWNSDKNKACMWKRQGFAGNEQSDQSAEFGRHCSKSWVSTQKKRLKQDKRWCWRTTSPLWRLRCCCHVLTMTGLDRLDWLVIACYSML